MTTNMDDFDAEKILNMSREKVIGLLENELSVKLNENLSNGIIAYKEFEEICKSTFSIPQQASLVRNTIFLNFLNQKVLIYLKIIKNRLIN